MCIRDRLGEFQSYRDVPNPAAGKAPEQRKNQVPKGKQQPVDVSVAQRPAVGVEVTNSAGDVRIITVTQDIARIGRSPTNEIVIEDESKRISREHARMRFVNGYWHVEDHHSGNGTQLDSQRLPPDVATRWEAGSIVQIEGYRLRLVEAGPVPDGFGLAEQPRPQVHARGGRRGPERVAREVEEALAPRVDHRVAEGVDLCEVLRPQGRDGGRGCGPVDLRRPGRRRVEGGELSGDVIEDEGDIGIVRADQVGQAPVIGHPAHDDEVIPRLAVGPARGKIGFKAHAEALFDPGCRVPQFLAADGKPFVTLFKSVQGEENKVLPPEFKAHAAKEPLIANRQFYVGAELPAKLVSDPKLMDALMDHWLACLLYTSPSPRDRTRSRMPSSA